MSPRYTYNVPLPPTASVFPLVLCAVQFIKKARKQITLGYQNHDHNNNNSSISEYGQQT